MKSLATICTTLFAVGCASTTDGVRFAEVDPRYVAPPQAASIAKLPVFGEKHGAIRVTLIGAFRVEGVYHLKAGASLSDATSNAQGLAGIPIGFVVWRDGKGLALWRGFHDDIDRFATQTMPKVALKDGDVVCAIPPPPI